MITLKKGDKAPSFSGKNQNDEIIGSEQLAGKKYILYFYPKDSTPGCTAEACDLRDNYNFWMKRGYTIIGVSTTSRMTQVPGHALVVLEAVFSREMMYGVATENCSYYCSIEVVYMIANQNRRFG